MQHLQQTLNDLREEELRIQQSISLIQGLLNRSTVEVNGHAVVEPLPQAPAVLQVKTKRTKLHWTQTDAGRRKMALMQKKAWKTRHANE